MWGIKLKSRTSLLFYPQSFFLQFSYTQHQTWYFQTIHMKYLVFSVDNVVNFVDILLIFC